MARYGEKRAAAGPRDDKPHIGFNRWGSAFRSEIQVNNDMTRFVRRCISLVRDGATPADIVNEAKTWNDEVRAVVATVAAQWIDLDVYQRWPVAIESCSALSTIKCQGKGYPPWADYDEWEERCHQWDQNRGIPSRRGEAKVVKRDLGELVEKMLADHGWEKA